MQRDICNIYFSGRVLFQPGDQHADVGGGQGAAGQAAPAQGNPVAAGGGAGPRGEAEPQRELQDPAGGAERAADQQAGHEERAVQAVQGGQVHHQGGKVPGENVKVPLTNAKVIHVIFCAQL